MFVIDSITTYEENRILSKIEQWVDKLPYRSVKIEVELPDKTLVLTKDRQRHPVFFRLLFLTCR